ncbi:hypothetical protein NFI96_022211, partial [Prochilodus magdalenae]
KHVLSLFSSRLCENLSYEVDKYTCCDGSIHQGANLSCCGRAAYNKLESSCCENTLTVGLSQTVSYCCGSKAYNPLNQICCKGVVHNKASAHTSCCDTSRHIQSNPTGDCSSPNLLNGNTSNTKIDQAGSADSKTPSCEQAFFNSPKEICCLGKTFLKGTGLSQCCGAESYELSEEGALCCNGHLYRNQPPGSTCTGNVPYSPQNFTACQKHVHFPAGQQCCGTKPFDPREDICCNGHRHKRLPGMACCGPQGYNSSDDTHLCCSGHLHKLTDKINKNEAECCGNVLLTNKEQKCCHSAENTLVYNIQPDHFCCGHFYYNTSLWGCCAGQLIPKPSNGTQAEVTLIRPLLDYNVSTICQQPVVLGTVESVAVKQNERFVVLKEVLEFNRTMIFSGNSLKIGPLDHCLSPALELGRTYLWVNRENKYKPLADVTGLTTPIHAILRLCQSIQTMCYAA